MTRTKFTHQEPLDHGKAKGDEGIARSEADNFCPRKGELGILGQLGAGEKARSQRRAVQVWHAGE